MRYCWVVLAVVVRGERFYACGECGLIYTTRDLAERCEEWCREHGTCSIDLSKQSVGYVRQAGLRLSSLGGSERRG